MFTRIGVYRMRLSNFLDIASRTFRDLRRMKQAFPGVPVRVEYVIDDWGSARFLAISKVFDIPIASLLDNHAIQTEEVRAFVSGEPELSQFFLRNSGQINESLRKKRTPFLLSQNAEEFVVLIRLSRCGTVSVADGSHRLAVLEHQGFTTAKVRLVVGDVMQRYSPTDLRWHS